jgi:hypothetical protein
MRKSLAAYALVFAAVVPAAITVTGTPSARASQEVSELIPAYIYPANLASGTAEQENGKNIWHHLCDTASTSGASSTIIANIDNGPGSSYDSNWASAMNYCANKRLNVVGYVYTSYGQRSVSSVEADIAEWVSLYGANVQGIFFDGVPTSATDSRCPDSDCESYYATIIAYAQSEISDALIITNPGSSNSDSGWILSNRAMNDHPADIDVIFEGDVSSFTSWSPPSWFESSESGSVATLVYQDPGTTDTAPADASAVCTDMQNDGAGIGVVWNNDSNDDTWSTDPTTVTGNGIWDDFVTDC